PPCGTATCAASSRKRTWTPCPAPAPAAPGNKRSARDGSISSSLSLQQIAFAPAGEDERFAVAFVDLIAQITNVDIDDVRRVLVLFVVKMFPDHRPADDAAAVKGEEFEQGVFAGC